MSLQRRVAALLHRLGGQFLYEALIRTLRGSLFIGVAAVVLTSTGAWKYLLSSFAAHDFVQASHLSLAGGSPKSSLVYMNRLSAIFMLPASIFPGLFRRGAPRDVHKG